ncbi:hypothetical protein ABE65_011830 [Fictibacillus phosphorivorans]|uniref:DUF3784 domain-containing protein n=1 Tax=Fictibacillus phosphorivorans TaxID=1221500 RepID=A0A168W1P7_9BACL|nr:DUF3784 domain-containing protein [Fictibacillus phosphorivorans]ANC77449.1 hypothetical protein ABE65_011830 [Fictibacillus phosphorivorans]
MGVAILIVLIPFLIFAILLSKGKGASLLAGYNTMSDSEKAQYDEVDLCKFMGKIMYGISFSILLFALSEMLENQILFIIGLISLLTFIIFALVYSNTRNRFKKNV